MNGDLGASFRQKANYMKGWKPASVPSNRDRLELYALHKQAVSGDAPASLNSGLSPGDKAKYEAWKKMAGLSQQEAMRLYLHEAERQTRVYGTATSITPQTTPASLPPPQPTSAQPRGLAAIPLLCAAASESRQAYLRRLSHTSPSNAWWKRQEALCATPGSVGALPESTLILLASLVEGFSLSAGDYLPLLPTPVVQSFLWPLHNVLLSLWMGLILQTTAWNALGDLLQTMVWGSRRTGLNLKSIYKDQVQWTSQSIALLQESHQPLSARLVGLALWPLSLLVHACGLLAGDDGSSVLWPSCAYGALLLSTWWYWWLVIPFLAIWIMLGGAVMAGNCYALIEMAGV